MFPLTIARAVDNEGIVVSRPGEVTSDFESLVSKQVDRLCRAAALPYEPERCWYYTLRKANVKLQQAPFSQGRSHVTTWAPGVISNAMVIKKTVERRPLLEW